MASLAPSVEKTLSTGVARPAVTHYAHLFTTVLGSGFALGAPQQVRKHCQQHVAAVGEKRQGAIHVTLASQEYLDADHLPSHNSCMTRISIASSSSENMSGQHSGQPEVAVLQLETARSCASSLNCCR